MTPESKLWKDFRKSSKIKYLKRIETKNEDGFPDVHAIHEGYSFFIELKCSGHVDPHKVPLRPDQVIWHRDCARNGGFSCILFQTKGQMVLIDGIDAVDVARTPHQWQKCEHKLGGDGFLLLDQHLIAAVRGHLVGCKYL